MKLPELLKRFYFDSQFCDCITQEKLTHSELKVKYKNYRNEEDYEVRAINQNRNEIYIAITTSTGLIALIETEPSRLLRLGNKCHLCDRTWSLYSCCKNPNYQKQFSRVYDGWIWKPDGRYEVLHISHEKDGCEQLCKHCELELAK